MLNDRQLSEVLRSFARTMLTDFPIQAILDLLVEQIVELMPITGAGVTMICTGVETRYVAASNDTALCCEQLQSEVGEGPCVVAYQSGRAIAIADLRREERFPSFSPVAVAAGLAAVFAFPLNHPDGAIGAMDLYRDTPGELDDYSIVAAQTLADVATAYLINAQGRAAMQLATERSRETSLHDPLTGLANRTLLLERLEHASARGRRTGLTSAVLFLDLDRFKTVNDTFGHQIGDEALVVVGERLSEVLRAGDTLARVSGDEFVILCEDLADAAQVDVVAQRVDAALFPPLVLSELELDISASVGIAFTGSGTATAGEILHAADTAMYRAKRTGGGHHIVFDQSDQNQADRQAGLERDMRGLLGRGELVLEYQPIVVATDGRTTGVEALVRWMHPRRGLVSPTVLIPLAERLGLIPAIGQWVLREALAEQQRWHDQYRVDDLGLCVNVSSHQLMATGFAGTVAAALADHGTNPASVTLEITESVIVRDATHALTVLNDLKDIGVKLALDDFGTGYSSLSYLLDFPVDLVKIDQGFVAGLGHNPASESIVTAVVQLAHGLGMEVVAEGVETGQQYAELTRLGCDGCQGFYFASPMRPSELTALIQHRADGADQILPALASAGIR